MRYKYLLLIFLQIILITTATLGIFISISQISSKKCETDRQDSCLQDNDCMCSENPCFLGNREYYEKCFLPQQKDIVRDCPDVCGFEPSDVEFEAVCENSRCKLASFNRTTGERMG